MDLKSLKSLISLSKWIKIKIQGEKMTQIRKVKLGWGQIKGDPSFLERLILHIERLRRFVYVRTKRAVMH